MSPAARIPGLFVRALFDIGRQYEESRFFEFPRQRPAANCDETTLSGRVKPFDFDAR